MGGISADSLGSSGPELEEAGVELTVISAFDSLAQNSANGCGRVACVMDDGKDASSAMSDHDLGSGISLLAKLAAKGHCAAAFSLKERLSGLAAYWTARQGSFTVGQRNVRP